MVWYVCMYVYILVCPSHCANSMLISVVFQVSHWQGRLWAPPHPEQLQGEDSKNVQQIAGEQIDQRALEL